tara:strand:+ start:1379 stop:2641 length:1263 start_codon:yes stop_codon:yes gene_type:complete
MHPFLISEKKLLNQKYLNYLSIICSLMVPLLVLGPALPDLILSLSSIWFLYFTIKNKIFRVYKNYYFYFFILFCSWCILTSLLSSDIFFSLKSSLPYFRIGIFALLISFLIDHNKEIFKYFYFSFIITFLILIIDGYFQYLTGYNLLGYKMANMRVSSFFKDELTLGSYLARLFPLFFAIFVVRKNKKKLEILAVSILFVLIEVLIFLAGERTSFVLLNLSTIFIILFITKYKFLRLTIFIISFLIIGYLVSHDDRYYSRYIKNPAESMGFHNSNIETKKYIFTESHDSIYKTAWKMFLDKPILGQGPRMYRVKCNDKNFSTGKSPCHTHPHNFYIQLLAETGLIGFLFLFFFKLHFIYIMASHTLNYFKKKKFLLSDYQICLLAGLLITIWPITSSGNFFGNNLMMFYSLQIGFFRTKI